MSKIIFPSSWSLNINDFDELSLRLSIPTDYLLSWDKKIPFFYRKKIIVKKGKERTLLIPTQELKSIQRKILDNLFNFEFPNCVHGGIPGRSIITNAKIHLKQKWVMCLDIRKFFPSVHFKKIYSNFISLNCSPEVAKLLTHFTTHKHQLPQGTPTSPAIANIVLYNFDKRIFNLCKIKGFKYSRYFDDVTISGCSNPKSLLEKCELITNQEGFKINKNSKKLRIMASTEEQIVTGLLVNGEKLQIPSKKIQKIQNKLEKLTSGDFSIFLNKEPVKIKATMKGYLAFLKSVEPQKTKELEERFRKINWDSFCS
ncbi:MAG: reverse transcriptase family protein [Candidatus Nealsonbacteria bacterium]